MSSEVVGGSMPSFGIVNAPDAELWRSPAAARVGRLAARSGVFLTHFEFRRHLSMPDHWVPPERGDLFGEPYWQGGRLVEPKYGPFRHDDPLGSFHPGHRGKWTAHELCHRLVGHAWRADASPLFLALGARLAELLPVVLYYFLDEAGLRRCDVHSGPLYGLFCRGCEVAALGGASGVVDEGWYRRGRAFLEGELAAVAKSRRLGRPVSYRYTTLDLQSDALAYVHAHRRRLGSRVFGRFAELFPSGGRCHGSLDGIEGRVWEVFDDLIGGREASALVGGREAWVAQDVAWRLLMVGEVCEGEVAGAIEGLVEGLAGDPGGVAGVIAGYEGLFEDFIIPEPVDVFATGYRLPGGYGFAVGQVVEGVGSVLPVTAGLLGDGLVGAVEGFVRGEVAVRGALGRRFAGFLAGGGAVGLEGGVGGGVAGVVGDVARYEAAVADAGGDGVGDALGEGAVGVDDRVRLGGGVELLGVSCDVQGVVEGGGDFWGG